MFSYEECFLSWSILLGYQICIWHQALLMLLTSDVFGNASSGVLAHIFIHVRMLAYSFVGGHTHMDFYAAGSENALKPL